MKNTLEIVVAIIVIVVLIMAMFFIEPLNLEDNIPNSSGEEFVEDVYVSFDEISAEYSMETARKEGTFIIDNKGNVYNKETLEEFLKFVRNNESAKLRIVQEDMSGDIQITEIQSNEESILVKYRGIDSAIIKNEYLKADGYSINSTTKLTSEGEWWNGCYIVKNEKDELILFGYAVKTNSKSGEEIASGENTNISDLTIEME